MNQSELIGHLDKVLQDLQSRLEQAEIQYETLLHKHNATHAAISTLAEQNTKLDRVLPGRSEDHLCSIY